MSSDRDTFTDASRDGSGQTQKKDVGYELSFAPISLEEERNREGYEPGDTPTGATKLNPMTTSGTRGAGDIRR